MKGRFRNIFLKGVWLGFAIFLSCEDVIELDGGEPQGEIVIYGLINNAKGPYEIRVSQVTKADQKATPVSGATVRVFDQDGIVEIAVEATDGVYRTGGEGICGEAGNSYFAEVELPDGNIYRSAPETMPLQNAIDSSYFEVLKVETLSSQGVTVETTVIRVYTDTEFSQGADPLFLKWDIHDVFLFQTVALPAFKFPRYAQSSCFFLEFNNPQQILLFDQSESPTLKIDQQLVAQAEIDVKFFNLHYFNVVQSSITEGAHRYWDQIDEITNRAGSIFDAPPAKVLGNFSNINDPDEEVLGYFEVSKMDTSRLFITRSSIPFLILDPCELPSLSFFTSIPFECFSCLADVLDPECYQSCALFDPDKVIPRPFYAEE